MRTKSIQLGIVLAAGILAGSMVSNIGALADNEEQNRLANAKVMFVQLEDDAAGNAAGWDVGGECTETAECEAFFIADSDVTSNSIVTISITDPVLIPGFEPEQPFTTVPSGVVHVFPNLGFTGACSCQVLENATLNYMIITPKLSD